MLKNYKKGFTLIELLVVIAIIGILSSVVLASLNSARTKGADAAIKADLTNQRAESEIFYDENSFSYEGVCATSGNSVIGDGVSAAAIKAGGTYTTGDDANATNTVDNPLDPMVAVCHDLATGWAALAPLKKGGGQCVDYTGVSKEVAITALDTDDDITCD